MTIAIDGQEYQIIVSERFLGIQYVGNSGGVIQLRAHFQIPQAELVSYIAYNAHLFGDSDAVKGELPEVCVQLFDKVYVLQVDFKSSRNYMLDNKVFVPKIPVSEKSVALLKADLLRTTILKQIGVWEERLDFLLNAIAIKKLKVNPYIIRKEVVVFDSRLIDRKSVLIDYIVAIALFDYLALAEEVQADLLDKFVVDWKQMKRIVSYERDSRGG